MSGLYIVIEIKIPDFDHYVSGRVLSRVEPVLHAVAQHQNVKPLMEFFSQNPEATLEILRSEGVPVKKQKPKILPEQWFEAKEGLATVQTLLKWVTENPERIKNHEALITELKDFKRVLERAQAAGVRWHLDVDY
ncbi:MAG: hypothetical protein HY774_20660 [Acidobacteria bacterium]|nr:hypothetical protein [Acidobacteriota bacterium]